MSIGGGVLILKGAWLAVEPMARSDAKPALVLGERVGIRAYCTVSASAGVTVGDDVVIGAMCSIVDSDHSWRTGDPNVLRNPSSAAPIKIGEGTWLGDGVRVLKGATIGRRCAIGANSVVKGVIPDFSIAVGTPARVVGVTSDL